MERPYDEWIPQGEQTFESNDVRSACTVEEVDDVCLLVSDFGPTRSDSGSDSDFDCYSHPDCDCDSDFDLRLKVMY